MEQEKIERIKEIFAGNEGALSVKVERKYTRADGSADDDGWAFSVKIVKSDALQSAIDLFAVDGEKEWNFTSFGSRPNYQKRPLYRGYFVNSVSRRNLDFILAKKKTVSLVMGSAYDVETLETYIREYLPKVFADAVACATREEGVTTFTLKATVEANEE